MSRRIARFGKIDVLLNNAGYGAYGVLEATPFDKIRRQFDVNVIGLLAVTKAVLPHFRANNAGIIINISSVNGKVTFPLGTLYQGTKFAVEGISESLTFELAAIGVKMKIIEPGAIKTDFACRSMDLSSDESLKEYQELTDKFSTVLTSFVQHGAEPELVARVIYQAATDGTDQLRYPAGPDAESLLSLRNTEDDTTFLQGIRKLFGM